MDPTPTTPTRRVLIVDDEPEILNLFRTYLEEDGWAVDTVERGEEALELFRRNSYDLILLDCIMPGLDGPTVHHKISQIFGYGRRVSQLLPPLLPPVLIVTGWYDDEKNERMLFGERVVGILRKPVSCARLVEIARDLWAWEVENRKRRTQIFEKTSDWAPPALAPLPVQADRSEALVLHQEGRGV